MPRDMVPGFVGLDTEQILHLLAIAHRIPGCLNPAITAPGNLRRLRGLRGVQRREVWEQVFNFQAMVNTAAHGNQFTNNPQEGVRVLFNMRTDGCSVRLVIKRPFRGPPPEEPASATVRCCAERALRLCAWACLACVYACVCVCVRVCVAVFCLMC